MRSLNGAFRRREVYSCVVDGARTQQVVDLVQAALRSMNLPLCAVNMILSILNALAKSLRVLTRERDGTGVCCHDLVVCWADRVDSNFGCS